MQEATTATIGCDLGERQSTVYVLWPDGRVERPGPVKTTKAAMRKFFTRPRAHVVIEVGTHSRWVSALLKELGHRVTVANPRRVKLISQSDSKSDQVDAELLARLGKADVELHPRRLGISFPTPSLAAMFLPLGLALYYLGCWAALLPTGSRSLGAPSCSVSVPLAYWQWWSLMCGRVWIEDGAAIRAQT